MRSLSASLRIAALAALVILVAGGLLAALVWLAQLAWESGPVWVPYLREQWLWVVVAMLLVLVESSLCASLRAHDSV